MARSPHDKLKALEDVLRKKEAEQAEAQQRAKKTEEELKRLKAALRAEQEEALFEEELVTRPQNQQRQEEEPEEPPRQEEDAFSIDDLVQDAPKNQQLGGALYSLQERMRGGMNLYEMTQTAQALTGLRQETALTQNQYNILNEFEEQLRDQGAQTDYSRQQLYAQQANQQVESLKEQLGVRVGNTLYSADDVFNP